MWRNNRATPTVTPTRAPRAPTHSAHTRTSAPRRTARSHPNRQPAAQYLGNCPNPRAKRKSRKGDEREETFDLATNVIRPSAPPRTASKVRGVRKKKAEFRRACFYIKSLGVPPGCALEPLMREPTQGCESEDSDPPSSQPPSFCLFVLCAALLSSDSRSCVHVPL